MLIIWRYLLCDTYLLRSRFNENRVNVNRVGARVKVFTKGAIHSTILQKFQEALRRVKGEVGRERRTRYGMVSLEPSSV